MRSLLPGHYEQREVIAAGGDAHPSKRLEAVLLICSSKLITGYS
jgi:hypothetical protein